MRRLIQIWRWVDDRTGASEALGPLFKHPVPPNTGWKYVLGSGTLVAFLIQVVTGTALATIYNSSPDGAYQSLQFITHGAVLGRFLRGMHWFGASAMFMLIAAHWTRVYLTGSYKFPREASWMSGILLVGCVVVMGYTGQLLRWDQNGVWSTVIAAEQAGRLPLIGHWVAEFILGGSTVNAVTLSRYFAIHVFFIPALIFGLVGLHLFLVIRNGISEPARAGHPVDPKTYRKWYEELLRRKGIPFWPDVAWRDAVFAVVIVAAIAILAWQIGPPELGKPPDPALLPALPRPDWYLLWYYAVLSLLPHYMENYVIVGAPVAAFLLLFFVPVIWNKGERSLARRPWSVFVIVLVYFLIFWFWRLGKIAPWSPRFNAPPVAANLVRISGSEVYEGAQLFSRKGCEQCHTFGGVGGLRGPDLTRVADRYPRQEIVLHILNGGLNMPAYGASLTSEELNRIVAFLESYKNLPFEAAPGAEGRRAK